MGDLLVLWWVWGVVGGWEAGVVTGQCVRWETYWYCGGCEVLCVDGWQVWWPCSVLDGRLVGTVVVVDVWMDGWPLWRVTCCCFRCGWWMAGKVGDFLVQWQIWGTVGWQISLVTCCCCVGCEVWWMDDRLVTCCVVVGVMCGRWKAMWCPNWWWGGWLDGRGGGWLVGIVVGLRCGGWMVGWLVGVVVGLRCGEWMAGWLVGVVVGVRCGGWVAWWWDLLVLWRVWGVVDGWQGGGWIVGVVVGVWWMDGRVVVTWCCGGCEVWWMSGSVVGNLFVLWWVWGVVNGWQGWWVTCWCYGRCEVWWLGGMDGRVVADLLVLWWVWGVVDGWQGGGDL